jgi:hypothetical protein
MFVVQELFLAQDPNLYYDDVNLSIDVDELISSDRLNIHGVANDLYDGRLALSRQPLIITEAA